MQKTFSYQSQSKGPRRVARKSPALVRQRLFASACSKVYNRQYPPKISSGEKSMGEPILHVPNLLIAIVAGYLIGALPLAVRISRRQGVDIFAVGTGLAGASNVLKRVGKVPAFLVLMGEIAKGVLAVFIGWILGVEGSWRLLPAAAAIFGHWSSIFSRFRGGDGLVTLGGVIIALFAMGGVLSVAIGGIVSLGGQRIRYTSLLSVVFAYSSVAMLSLIKQEQLALTLGVGGLAAMVLARAISGHMKRRQGDEWGELGETGAVESTGTG